MDETVFQWVTICLIVLLLVGIYVKPLDKIQGNKDVSALQFIYEQCMNETSINLTFSTGAFYLAKENSVCLLKGE